MSRLCNVDPEQLVLSATAVAIALSRVFSGDDLNILSALFNSVGDLLSVFAAREVCESSAEQLENQPEEETEDEVQTQESGDPDGPDTGFSETSDT